MPKPCCPWKDSPESLRRMRRYAGRRLALFLTTLDDEAMGLRYVKWNQWNCNKEREMWPMSCGKDRQNFRVQGSKWPVTFAQKAAWQWQKPGAGHPKKRKARLGSEPYVRAVVGLDYCAAGVGAPGNWLGTSPTLKRAKRRMVMFSPSLAMAWVIFSPMVTVSSLMKCCS